MKIKGYIKVDMWFDKNLQLYGATYKDNKNNVICEPEFAPTKLLALQWLKQNAPDFEFEKQLPNRDY